MLINLNYYNKNNSLCDFNIRSVRQLFTINRDFKTYGIKNAWPKARPNSKYYYNISEVFL